MKSLEIQKPNHLQLYPRDEEILKKMFAEYERLIIEAEFKGGFSSSRVFLVRPFREGQSELRTVVKSAPAYLIQKEEQAYQTYIHNKLPKASELHQSIYIGDWAGLRYQLEGGGIFTVESLFVYLNRPEIDLGHIVEHTLKGRLFRSMGQLWRKVERTQEGFFIRGSYDPLLPVNLVISVLNEESLPTEITPHNVTPETIAGQTLKSGDYVRLEGFEITEIDPYEIEPCSKEVTEIRYPTPEGGRRRRKG